MRTLSILMFTCTIFGIGLIGCQNKANRLMDGIYEGQSRSKYTDEPFVGVSKIQIKNGSIVKVNFEIIDTSKNELFNGDYEKHFIGNDEYINQCRNDWKGVLNYPDILIQKQSMDSIDAVSGATWSFNLFKSSACIALKKAITQ